MNNVLWLFNTCGPIVFAAIMTGLLIALIMCARVSFASTTRRTQRLAIGLALLPFVLSICGFIFGLVFCWIAGVPNISWLALGKVILAGAVVSSVPMIWALLVFRSRRHSGMSAA